MVPSVGLRHSDTEKWFFQHCLDLLTGTAESDLPSPLFILKMHKDAFEEIYSLRNKIDIAPMKSNNTLPSKTGI